MTTSFIREIFVQDIFDAKREIPNKRTKPIAWPSEASASIAGIHVGECHRSMYYKIKGVPPTEPISIEGRRIFDAGLAGEAYLIDSYKSKDLLIEQQISLELPIPNSRNKVIVKGKIDAIVKYQNKKSAIEIKTVGEYKAVKIFGDKGLPSPENLMQAMLYKYYLSNTKEGQEKQIDKFYLEYLNRSTYDRTYYEIDIDDSGYAIITSIDKTDKELFTIKLSEVKSINELRSTAGISDSYDHRLAKLKININDIFESYDSIYDNVNSDVLPDRDYQLVFDKDSIEDAYLIGQISKIKYNKTKKGTPIGDDKCMYCVYKTKCLNDSGIKTK